MLGPGVQIKAVEGDPLFANRDFRQAWPDKSIKPVFVHAEVEWCIAQPHQSRHDPLKAV
ncbi:MAG: hypothetical protein ACREX9_02555 [Gammaproteobacteria bacterium]